MKEPEKPTLEMDEISEMVQKLIKEGKGPVFMFCVSGQVAGGVAIKIQMDTNVNYSKEMAVAYVMSKRYELKDMKPWLFGQIGPNSILNIFCLHTTATTKNAISDQNLALRAAPRVTHVPLRRMEG